MDFKIETPIKIGSKIYTIEDCKIEEYYVEGVEFDKTPKFEDELKYVVIVNLERYNDNINSYKTSRRLVNCFSSKDELLGQL